MKYTKMTSKGQITLPLEVRENLGLQPGDKVEIVHSPNGYLIKKEALPSPFPKFIGSLKQKGKPDDIIEDLRGK